MKGTLQDWRKMTLAGLRAERERLMETVKQLNDLDTLIHAIEGAKLSSQRGPYKAKTVAKSKQVHWSKRKDVDPKKLAAWKKQMAVNASKRRKAKAAQ